MKSAAIFPGSVGAIAKRFGVDVHQVEYVIRARALKSVGRAGNANLYDESTVERIGVELEQVAAKKQAGAVPALAGAETAAAR